MRTSFDIGSLLPPKVGFLGSGLAHTVIKVMGGVIVQSEPVVVVADDAWLYTTEWQAGETQADMDAAAGLGVRYSTIDDFLDDLN